MSYAAIGRGEIDTVLSYSDRSIQVNVPVGAVAGQTYRGHDGVREFFADLDEAWEQFDPELETIEADCDHVLALGTTRVRGRGSGIEMEFAWGHVVEFRDGKVIRLIGYLDRDEAREAFLEHARS
jgi:ketosteroid isomerase-like protein